jgi:hypothetical protein
VTGGAIERLLCLHHQASLVQQDAQLDTRLGIALLIGPPPGRFGPARVSRPLQSHPQPNDRLLVTTRLAPSPSGDSTHEIAFVKKKLSDSKRCVGITSRVGTPVRSFCAPGVISALQRASYDPCCSRMPATIGSAPRRLGSFVIAAFLKQVSEHHRCLGASSLIRTTEGFLGCLVIPSI